MNILDKIVARKRIEVASAKVSKPQGAFEHDPLFSRSTLSLVKALRQSHVPSIISEFKRQSPSKGIINDQVTPEIVTTGYVAAGACGLSVLTDQEFFGGSFADFEQARAANPRTPMLRKDFMIDEYQLFEARALGADVVLLIAACLSPSEVQGLARKAHDLDLEVVLEVHDADELSESLCDEVDIVGVNNRNLKNFSTSVDTSLELASIIPDRFLKISESSLRDAATIIQLAGVGYQGFLIGETFMKEPDPAAALEKLQKELLELINYKTLIV